MKRSFIDKMLDNHGHKIGAALYALSAATMIGVMIISFMLVAPKWIEVQEQLTAALSQEANQ